MAVSSALNTERGLPDRQALWYNPLLAAVTRINTTTVLSFSDKCGQKDKLLDPAASALQSMQNDCNQAEQAIRAAAVIVQNGDLSEVNRKIDRLTKLPRQGSSISAIVNLLVQQNDRAALAVLLDRLPELDLENKLADGVDHARATIAIGQAKLLSPDEQARATELRELVNNIKRVRDNFEQLGQFLAELRRPQTVNGQFKRIAKLFAWVGLPGDDMPKANYILLEDDFGNVYSGFAMDRNPGIRRPIPDRQDYTLAPFAAPEAGGVYGDDLAAESAQVFRTQYGVSSNYTALLK